jgi:anti-sigma regulatory factor (Ser/Thr protein kinase)
MPTVELSFTANPAQVRTVRLVAAAVARLFGVADDLLDGIRLAVGEACSRAVELHQAAQVAAPVVVSLQDTGRFTVVVVDRTPAPSDLGEAELELDDSRAAGPASTHPDGARVADEAEQATAAQMRLRLLAGLVHDLSVTSNPDGPGSQVRMTWPLAASRPTPSAGRGTTGTRGTSTARGTTGTRNSQSRQPPRGVSGAAPDG